MAIYDELALKTFMGELTGRILDMIRLRNTTIFYIELHRISYVVRLRERKNLLDIPRNKFNPNFNSI